MSRDDSNQRPLALAEIRERLRKLRGQQYWRAIEELADSSRFHRFLEAEFPQQARALFGAVNRRQALKVMAASLALGGLTACTRQPDERMVPWVLPPEEVVPGVPLFYATAMPFNGYGNGLLVESHMGRPTKAEGNPQHPASLGATDVFGQASVLTLYDPDRSQVITRQGRVQGWYGFVAALRDAVASLSHGSGLRILTETVTSPTLADQIQRLLKRYPEAKWHQYQPVNRDNVRAGAQLAFGQIVNPIYRFDEADVILSLDADFLFALPGSLAYARQFAARRDPLTWGQSMSRLYAVETMPSITGAVADHRLPVRPGEMEGFAGAVAGELRIADCGLRNADFKQPQSEIRNWIGALARDLQRSRGHCLVLAGDPQPPAVHALTHALNAQLGNVGNTVLYTEPAEASPVMETESLRELVADMNAGRVQLLLVLGANPALMAPHDFDFAGAMRNVKLRVHLGLYQDETGAASDWHIPESHFLEAWGDVRAYDGTASIIQPLIAPLFDSKSACQLIWALLGNADENTYDVLRAYWKGRSLSPNFEKFWQTSVHDGVIAGTAAKPVESRISDLGLQISSPAAGNPQSAIRNPKLDGLEVCFRPDPTIWDGRFCNNGWLQEIGKPLSRITWDNAAYVSWNTAKRLGLNGEQVVELHLGGSSVMAAVWIMPGHADDAVTVTLGYGRSHPGRVGMNHGYNPYAIRFADRQWSAPGLEIRKRLFQHQLARIQLEQDQHERELVRHATLAKFRRNPDFVRETREQKPPEHSLYPGYPYEGYAWGMAIDLNRCIGCNACVAACYAENNIPVVGQAETQRGRSLPWLRLDAYYEGNLGNPKVFFQPVPCMQCENAPCETVCPVGATLHDKEGLNQMVYNRCVGTRYCSNNCPYKVRRFNFFRYADWYTPTPGMQKNPDVTVRSRGVMEKCTYCIQRIQAAKIEAEKQDRKVRDGEIRTACQQACPTEAIIFGDINDPKSRVAKLRSQSRNYGMLAELNTRPRTTYLGRITNPNPEIERE